MKEINRKNSNDRRWNLKYLKEKYGIDDSFIACQLTDLDFPMPSFIFCQIIKRCRLNHLVILY
ncbi:hypothetical protein P344_06355 [Spiroplasma mirum ATCC 29335]|uniref:Uncharacterized protein n=1 Tax=Spiroplasma mirum ATCC 29335 TaxID=838561 RepID=W6AXV2_9MOLU|nr:hypothetical protein P344_06355 [Spiroplasma mirum ATCC 29335]